MALGKSISCVFAIIGTFAFVDQAAADDLRCGDRLVSTGSSTYEVQTLCGVPDGVGHHVESRTIQRAVSVPCNDPRGGGRCVVYVADTVEVSVEDWTYDFGPMRFLQFLRFEQGQLTTIRAGGYGHKVS